MKIETITSQHRRDFTATLVCEHCEASQTLTTGYDDDYYHRKVIPKIKCVSCGEIAPDDHRPLTTKYHESETV